MYSSWIQYLYAQAVTRHKHSKHGGLLEIIMPDQDLSFLTLITSLMELGKADKIFVPENPPVICNEWRKLDA